MKSKYILIFLTIMVLLTGCTSSNQQSEDLKAREKLINDLQVENNNYQKQVEELIKEVEKLQLSIKDLKPSIDEQVSLDENSKEILSFMSSYHGQIIPSDNQPSYHIAWLDSKQPLRILPSESAPYISNHQITYKFDGIGYDQKSLVEVYAFVHSEVDDGWALVNNDNSNFGYVKAKFLEPFIQLDDISYSPKEQFSNIRLGITVDEIYNKYMGRIEVIHERNGYSQMIQVMSEGSDETNASSNGEIAFFYDLTSRKINFISSSSDKYVLESGYKVGDDTKEVFEYYDSKYKLIDAFTSEGCRRYDIGNGYSLDIYGDINEGGKINNITINGGYNIYT